MTMNSNRRWAQRAAACAATAIVLSVCAICFWNLAQKSSHCPIDSTVLAFLCFVLPLLFVVWHVISMDPSDSHTTSSLILQYLFQLFLLRLGSSAHKHLKAASQRLASTQTSLLKRILTRNQQTTYGSAHRFGEIFSREDFVRQVPLTTYSDYVDYVREVVEGNGRPEVLTSDPVVFLAISAGTTGKNKVIPLTSFTRRAAKEVGPMMFYRQVGIEGLSLKRVLLLSYGVETIRCPSGLSLGPISAHIARFPPYVVTPHEVYKVTDELVALHLHSVFGLAEWDVGRMEALMSTLVYSFWRHVESNWSLICDVIETGRLEFPRCMVEEADVEQLRAVFDSHLSPNPTRASQLREEFRRGFVGIAGRIWPNIRSVKMVTSGGFVHHARVLRQIYMHGVEQLSPLHAASEGFFGVNMSDKYDSGEPVYTLMPQYGFFEFIEEKKIGELQPQTLFAEQVQVNRSYEIVYTSQTGLYRYRTGDVVTIVGFFNQCPNYTFAYRVGQMLNLYWEKTPERVFYNAICRVVDSVDGLVLLDYMATEDIFVPSLAEFTKTPKHYVLFIEVEKDGAETRLSDEVKHKFDESLMMEFDLYSKLRQARSIGPMRVFQLRHGAFGRVKSRRHGRRPPTLTNAASSPQYKVPRVVRDAAYLQLLIDEILV